MEHKSPIYVWKKCKISPVNEIANVRENPTTESQIVGRIGKNTIADIAIDNKIENNEGIWLPIRNSKFQGYIRFDVVVVEIPPSSELLHKKDLPMSQENTALSQALPSPSTSKSDIANKITVPLIAEIQLDEKINDEEFENLKKLIQFLFKNATISTPIVVQSTK